MTACERQARIQSTRTEITVRSREEYEMTQITPGRQDAHHAADRTGADATAFAETLVAFRDSLPPRQREAFAAMVAAGAGAEGDDVQGYFVSHYASLIRNAVWTVGHERGGGGYYEALMQAVSATLPEPPERA
jgi:hypothetical protein